MNEMMTLPSEPAFEEKMHQAVRQGKAEFLIHKLKQYIEDETITKDIPTVLKRCITIQDAVYRDWTKSRDAFASPYDYCQIGQFRPVYSNLLLVNNGEVIQEQQEIERIKAFYAEITQYAWLASSLTLPINDDRNMSFVYGQELFLELKESLIRRFIEVELAVNPFEQEKIMAIPMLRDVYSNYWDEHFKEYVRNSSEPLAWLYRLLKPSGKLLEWNSMVYSNLVGEGALDSYAKERLGLDLPQEIIQDLAQISGAHNGTALSEINFDHHPFLVVAKNGGMRKVKVVNYDIGRTGDFKVSRNNVIYRRKPQTVMATSSSVTTRDR